MLCVKVEINFHEGDIFSCCGPDGICARIVVNVKKYLVFAMCPNHESVISELEPCKGFVKLGWFPLDRPQIDWNSGTKQVPMAVPLQLEEK